MEAGKAGLNGNIFWSVRVVRYGDLSNPKTYDNTGAKLAPGRKMTVEQPGEEGGQPSGQPQQGAGNTKP
jgi:hypothetical protein